jgi:hypothetical protein
MAESQRMSRYVLLFAAVHFPIALAVGFALQSLAARRSSGIGILLIYGVASIVGWQFVKVHKRHFMDGERRRLVAGCLLYILVFEAFGVWGSVETLSSLSAKAWLGVAAFVMLMDGLAIWLSFRYPVRSMMQKRLDRLAAGP